MQEANTEPFVLKLQLPEPEKVSEEKTEQKIEKDLSTLSKKEKMKVCYSVLVDLVLYQTSDWSAIRKLYIYLDIFSSWQEMTWHCF